MNSLENLCAIIAKAPQNHREFALQSTQIRCVINVNSPLYDFIVVGEKMCYRYAIATQSLLNRCAIAAASL
jgi:hypothetical protein